MIQAMKFLSLLLCVGLGFSAFADGDYTGNRIDALHYRTAAGMSTVTLGLQTPLQDWTVETQNGMNIGQRYYAYAEAQALYTYGITDRFSMSLAANYMIKQSTAISMRAIMNSKPV